MTNPTPAISQTALRAQTFRSLHRNPGTPLLLCNVYDPISARTVGAHPQCKALATASYALAASIGKPDEDLTVQDNLSLIRPISAVAHELDLPLSVDLQDGYAAPDDLDSLRATITTLITELGVVGINLEDSWHETVRTNVDTSTSITGIAGSIIPEDHAIERIRTVLSTARSLGVQDFVINARSDTFLLGGSLDDSIRRGRKFLEAGAETVFIFWPPHWEMKRTDVQRVIDELGGRVNVSCRLGEMGEGKGGLTPRDLAQMGAARVSVGPAVYRAAVAAVREAAGKVFQGV